jgi:hypothetical protein
VDLDTAGRIGALDRDRRNLVLTKHVRESNAQLEPPRLLIGQVLGKRLEPIISAAHRLVLFPLKPTLGRTAQPDQRFQAKHNAVCFNQLP